MKNTMQNEPLITIPWKTYVKITVESLIAFYIATFCMGMYFTHRGQGGLVTSILLGLLYVFVIIACAKRILEKLSMPALMIVIPITPLLALIIVVTLIPILEKLQ
jgi:hypothetical protein